MPAPSRTTAKTTENAEDYLERIYELIQQKGYARVSDIAAQLKLARPSVSMMIQRLGKRGFVEYEKYRGLSLTPKGAQVAKRIQSRHKILTQFLTLLGLDAQTVERDVEGIEHHLSEKTLKKLERIVTASKSRPQTLRALLQGKAD